MSYRPPDFTGPHVLDLSRTGATVIALIALAALVAIVALAGDAQPAPVPVPSDSLEPAVTITRTVPTPVITVRWAR